MKKIKPELFFSILILIVGTLLILITPIGAGFDEDTHIGRIWEMSKGVLIPNQLLGKGANYPYTFYQLSYRQDVNLNPVSWETWKSQMKVKIDWTNMIDHKTRATYFPTFYLPQAFIMGIMGRLFDLPVGIIYYCLRFSYLLSFVILIYFAIRIIPFGKWMLGFLSILPMSLVQASIISIDGINNGICFLFIAWVLYLNSDQKKAAYSRKDLFITLILSTAITTLKLNSLPLLSLLFMVPRIKYGSKKTLLISIFIILIAVCMISIGWNLLILEKPSTTATGEIDVLTNALVIFSNPLHFINALLNNIGTLFGRYYIEWVGVSGYGYWDMPVLIYLIVPFFILIAILSDGYTHILNSRKRIWMAVVSLLIFIFTIVIFFLLLGSPNSIEIPGVQGRYFIIAFPLLLLAFVPKRVIWKSGIKWVQIGAVLLTLVSSSALFLVYHFNCGSSFYSFETCYLPKYKNWDPSFGINMPISDPIPVRQTFTSECENLDQLRIWVPSRPKDTSAQISLNLVDAKTNEIVESKIYSGEDFPSSGWMYFQFNPIRDSKSKEYVITAESLNALHSQDVSFSYYERNEYLAGELTIAGKPNKGDLLFQYGCETGLAEIIHSNK